MNTNLLHILMVLTIAGVPACAAVNTDAPSDVGTAVFALTGNIEGVTSLTLSIYDGPVTDLSTQTPTFQPIACQKYAGKDGNRIKLQYLKASSNYTLYVQMFGDDKCQKPVGFAWRGNVEVVGGTDLAQVVPTYYVQPYLLGQFTGLAPAPQMPSCKPDSDCESLQLGATCGMALKCVLPACSGDADCKSVHPNATCDTTSHRCLLTNLFPLNGGATRGLPSSAALGDGSVAVFGGLSELIAGNWTAISQTAEVFDPVTGYFRAVSAGLNEFKAVGLAVAVTDGAQAVAVVGGSVDASFALDPGKSLKTTLDAAGCPNPKNCPVSNLLQRWDLANEAKTELPMLVPPGTLPIVSRVRNKAGDFLLIAGGNVAPLSKLPTNDTRQALAQLCDLSKKDTITCAPSKNSMGVGRANAATACLESTADGTCTKLFILGGRKKAGTPLAEAYDAESDAFVPITVAESAVSTLLLHGGNLFKLANGSFLLLGASNQAIFMEDDLVTGPASLQPPMIVTVTQGPSSLTMQMTPVPMGNFVDKGKRLLATAVALRDGSTLLMGGLDENLQPMKTAVLFGPTGLPLANPDLSAARVGGTAALLGGKSALGGCVLLAGGFTADPTGAMTPQNHVEVFCPGQ